VKETKVSSLKVSGQEGAGQRMESIQQNMADEWTIRTQFCWFA